MTTGTDGGRKGPQQWRRDTHPHEPVGDEGLRDAGGCRQTHGCRVMYRRPPCHNTSMRRTARRMRTAAASSSGKRNSATAAPWAMSPPSMPRKNAHDASTCVEFVGPPRVSTYTTVMSVNVTIHPHKAATAIDGIMR